MQTKITEYALSVKNIDLKCLYFSLKSIEINLIA